MPDDVFVETPANTAPPVEAVWMIVSRDQEGRENVCGSLLGPLGFTPFMTGNPAILERFRALIPNLARTAAQEGRTIHLLRFGQREEIESW